MKIKILSLMLFALLATQAVSRQAFAGGQRSNLINNLYYGLLGRAPDAGGYAAWTSYANSNGVSCQQIAADFIGSYEFYLDNVWSGSSNLTAEEFVVRMYEGLLGRYPDPAGEAAYVAVINSHPNSDIRAQVAMAMLNSTEFTNDCQNTYGFPWYLSYGFKPTGYFNDL